MNFEDIEIGKKYSLFVSWNAGYLMLFNKPFTIQDSMKRIELYEDGRLSPDFVAELNVAEQLNKILNFFEVIDKDIKTGCLKVNCVQLFHPDDLRSKFDQFRSPLKIKTAIGWTKIHNYEEVVEVIDT